MTGSEVAGDQYVVELRYWSRGGPGCSEYRASSAGERRGEWSDHVEIAKQDGVWCIGSEVASEPL